MAALIGIDMAEFDELVRSKVFHRLPSGKFRATECVRAYIRHLREHYERKHSRPTQAEVGEHLGIHQTKVGPWLSSLGLSNKTANLDEIRLAYISRLREQASGIYTGTGLNLAEERAGLAREQKLITRIKKQQALGEFAPVENITLLLSRIAAQMASIFDGIPGLLRMKCSHLTGDDVLMIRSELSRARMLLFDTGMDAVRDAAHAAADYVAEYEPADDGQPDPLV